MTKFLKKTVFIFAAVFLCSFAFSQNLFDEAKILTSEQRTELNSQLKRISSEHNVGIYIVTIQDYSAFGVSIEDAAETIYEKNNFGFGENKDGFMFLVSMSDRSYDLDAFNKGGVIFTSGKRARLEDSFLPYFRENDWFGGMYTFADRVENYLISYDNGELDEDTLSVIYMSGFGVFAISLIISLVLLSKEKKKLLSVMMADNANMYSSEKGVAYSENKDLFRYSTVRQRVIESSSSSGSRSYSGGGRSHSSGGHSHSSGHF